MAGRHSSRYPPSTHVRSLAFLANFSSPALVLSLKPCPPRLYKPVARRRPEVWYTSHRGRNLAGEMSSGRHFLANYKEKSHETSRTLSPGGFFYFSPSIR